MLKKKKILVILGGISKERAISIDTGLSCIKALKKLGVSRESIRRKKKIIELRRREHQVLHANSQVIERKWVSLLSSNARTF